MRRVTGVGGIFFKSKDPKALGEWYRVHLGLDVEEWGGVAFRWADDNDTGTGTTFGWVMDPQGNWIELWQPPSGQ